MSANPFAKQVSPRAPHPRCPSACSPRSAAAPSPPSLRAPGLSAHRLPPKPHGTQRQQVSNGPWAKLSCFISLSRHTCVRRLSLSCSMPCPAARSARRWLCPRPAQQPSAVSTPGRAGGFGRGVRATAAMQEQAPGTPCSTAVPRDLHPLIPCDQLKASRSPGPAENKQKPGLGSCNPQGRDRRGRDTERGAFSQSTSPLPLQRGRGSASLPAPGRPGCPAQASPRAAFSSTHKNPAREKSTYFKSCLM